MKVLGFFSSFALLISWGILSFSTNVVAQSSGNILDVIEKSGFDQGNDQIPNSSRVTITPETGINPSDFQLEVRQTPVTFDAHTLNLILKLLDFIWLLRYLVIGFIFLYIAYFFTCFIKGKKNKWKEGKANELQEKGQREEDKRAGMNACNSSEMADIIRDEHLSLKKERIFKEILSSSSSQSSKKQDQPKNS